MRGVILHGLVGVASLVTALGGCGTPVTTVSDLREGSAELSVTSPLQSDGDVIVGTTLRLTTSAQMSDGKGFESDPAVQITILNSKGEIVLKSARRTGVQLQWGIELPYGDGEYVAVVDLDPAPKQGPWKRKFRIDATPPALRIVAAIEGTQGSSGRKLQTKSIVANEKLANCTASVESGVASSDGSVAKILEDQPMVADAPGPDGLTFRLAPVDIPDDFPNLLHVRVQCEDEAGNSNTVFETVRIEQPTFDFAAVVTGKTGIPTELGDPPQVHTFVLAPAAGGATQFELGLGLLDKESGQAVAEGVVVREKSRLQVVVSDFEITSPADIAQASTDPSATEKRIFVRKLFATPIAVSVPSSLTGSTTLYVTLTQLREDTQTEAVLGSKPIRIYVQPFAGGLEYTWSAGTVQAAQKDAVLSLSATIRPKNGIGAPRDGYPLVEYTNDGETWQEISASDWQQVGDGSDQFRFKVAYPFADEQPFRLRLRGRNLAGGESISTMSPRIVGSATLTYLNPAAASCSGVGLKIQLASRFACKQPNSTKYYLAFQVENQGNTVPNFDSQIPCGSQSTLNCMTLHRGELTERLAVNALEDTSFKNNAGTYVQLSMNENEFLALPRIEFLVGATDVHTVLCPNSVTNPEFDLAALGVTKGPSRIPCE